MQAKHVEADGLVSDSYEQKFSVPDDVDTARLTSGISKVPNLKRVNQFLDSQVFDYYPNLTLI